MRSDKFHLQAFTLLELLVVMALSGILLLLSWQALQIVQGSFYQFKERKEELLEVQGFYSRLQRDMLQAQVVKAHSRGITCEGKRNLQYVFERDLVIRREGIQQDTFACRVLSYVPYFKGEPQMLSGQLVDGLEVELEYRGEQVSTYLVKEYDQLRLMN